MIAIVAGFATATTKKPNNYYHLKNNLVSFTPTKSLFTKSASNMSTTTTTTTTATTTMLASSAASPEPSTPVVLSSTESKTAKIWNRFANTYAKSPIKDEESYQIKLEMTRKYLTPYSNVLEFGCGTGGTALLHAPYVQKIHGIDLSSNMIDICNANKKEQETEQGGTPLSNLSFECTGIDSLSSASTKESYDVILGLSILHLLPNKDEVLQKVHTLLKPGGYFVSSTMCLTESVPKFVGWLAPTLSRFGVIPPLNVFSKQELRTSLEQAGFELEEEFHPSKDKAVFLIARKKY